ncbi:MAG TPA: M14 family zinc carboxypeptidase, partial [Vicinamibacterales bacterium]
LGLESTGIRVPLAKTPESVEDPAGEPTSILIGRTHPHVQRLVDDKKLDLGTLSPGQGLLRMVPRAFGSSSALVVTGGDARGVARATTQLAERLPHVWERGKDRTTLESIEDDARRLISGRSPEGQAAHALYQLTRLSREVSGKQLESARFGIYVEKAPAGFAEFVRAEVGRLFKAESVDVTVANIDIHSPVPVFKDDFEVPSEVDDLRAIVRTKVLPAAATERGRPGAPVVIEARVSEPPEVRRALEQEIRDQLAQAGVKDARVSILSAYKQGLSWLTEAVGPALEAKGAKSVTIRFAELSRPKDMKLPATAPEGSARWQAMYSPIRWLLEAYPADELLARDLGLPLDSVKFEKAPVGSTTYEVIAHDAAGGEVHRATFEPTFVYRTYFDQFPNYEVVRVTTGWIRATVGGRPVADERIVTDIEKFWDHYQQKTLPRIYAYTMDLFEGKPDPAAAPYFAELTVDLSLSEPDFRLGLDEEQVASLESIHEEVYFTTLHFFDVFGRYTDGSPLNYPGRIIPVMRPKADGKAGRASITFSGKAADRPKVTLEYRERGRPPVERTLRLPKIAIERPSAVAAWVRDGRDGIERLELKIEADFAEDTRADLVRKSDDDQVDDSVLFGPQAVAVVHNLRRLHEAGVFTGALVYHDLGEIAFSIEWPGGSTVETIASTGKPEPWKDLRTLARGYKYDGQRIVHWDDPISPPEAYEMLAKMSTFPEVTPYRVGESFLGKDIWAADVMPSMKASHWSQAKATTLKPTVVYSARQHANEVSSTSHTMRLIELLLTDPEYKKYLQKVNVVIHPITNPDGAQLAYDLQKITPNHMLHAGYLGALGVDATSGGNQEDPIYPEAKVRPMLRRMWLPDAFLNPHGYPSHEWVQVFSEYMAWVRSREPGGRGWCCNRGWYTSINYPAGEEFEGHKEVALALREYIVEGINSDPAVRAMNERNYARYTRYGYTFDPENFKLNIYKGVNVYMPPKGTRRDAPGAREERGEANPRITYINSGTEAPDETARGDWMKIVASAGLQWDLAVLRLLNDMEFEIETRREMTAAGVSLAVFRERPGKPPKTAPDTTAQKEAPETGASWRNNR